MQPRVPLGGAPRVLGVLRTPDGVATIRPKAMLTPHKAAAFPSRLCTLTGLEVAWKARRWLKKSNSQDAAETSMTRCTTVERAVESCTEAVLAAQAEGTSTPHVRRITVNSHILNVTS